MWVSWLTICKQASHCLGEVTRQIGGLPGFLVSHSSCHLELPSQFTRASSARHQASVDPLPRWVAAPMDCLLIDGSAQSTGIPRDWTTVQESPHLGNAPNNGERKSFQCGEFWIGTPACSLSWKEIHLKKGSLSREDASFRMACRQICEAASRLMIDVWESSSLWVGPILEGSPRLYSKANWASPGEPVGKQFSSKVSALVPALTSLSDQVWP